MGQIKLLALSLFFYTAPTSYGQDFSCDDFTDTELYPHSHYDEEELIGYTQGGTQTIMTGEEAMIELNSTEPPLPGIFGFDYAIFSFDGTGKTARFKGYLDTLVLFDATGFSVNGSPMTYLDESFPLTIDDVEVDISWHEPDYGPGEDFFLAFTGYYLTFTGEIDEITFTLFESGIAELCVEKDYNSLGLMTNQPEQELLLYPNPTQQDIHVTHSKIIDNITVYNISGQEMIHEQIQQKETRLNLSELVPGIYVIKIIARDGTETIEKLILE